MTMLIMTDVADISKMVDLIRQNDIRCVRQRNDIFVWNENNERVQLDATWDAVNKFLED